MARILLVDDDSSILELLSETLTALGYLVETAENGQVALTKLRTTKLPKLIILDLNMPVMDGFEFMRIIKNEEVLKQIPVIVFSGIAEEAKEIGAADFIQKPCSPQSLIQVLRRYLSNRSNLENGNK